MSQRFSLMIRFRPRSGGLPQGKQPGAVFLWDAPWPIVRLLEGRRQKNGKTLVSGGRLCLSLEISLSGRHQVQEDGHE